MVAGDIPETVTVGETIVFKPTTQINGDWSKLTYSWTVNGQAQTTTENRFSFTPETRGDYRVVFKADNQGKIDSAVYELFVNGTYENGFFLINEGWFGHEAGSVTFYPYGADTVQTWANKRANPGLDLGNTTQYGHIHNGKMYLISKQGYAGRANLAVVDAYSLKEVAQIADLPSDGRAFAGVDATRGLMTANSGLYRFDLSTNTLGTTVADVTGQTGDILVNGNYVYVISSTKGLMILNASDYSVAKNITGINIGFVKSNDGRIWAAGGTKLVSIHPTTLDTTNTTLPFTAYASWGAWQKGSIAYSPDNNAIYLVKMKAYGQDGNEIFKYTIGGAAPATFATYPGKILYRAIAYDTKLKQLIVTSLNGFGTAAAFNQLMFVNPETAATDKLIEYKGYYFPAMTLFQ
ncbi:DUF5074 domain-containing protein [Chitinophaga sedimenti]|uniref:DUF5074 domain-containing protein n=1 Tax=Chitinophaga sedimenti TaxID=2033606 RepID=UPI002005F541|nr:DUF5074 domain-containing protein [Chitinophaga sedimenti]MCK7559833.1 DUF5074 domain-containing protein [Chitinophaga sedimenti]